MASYRFILVEERSPGVLLVTLNRPQQLNALSSGLLDELGSALLAASQDAAVRAVVLAGNERSFSAGADIKEMVGGGIAAIDNPARAEAQARIVRFPKPLIAAVEGYCYGGGNELALACDMIIAGEKARFGQPEIDIGVIPGDGGTQRIPRVAGKGLAMKMCLLGEPIDAQTALAAGLVVEVVAAGQAVARALELAAKIATKAPVAVRLTKYAILAAFSTTLEQGLEVERQAARLGFTTEDQKEGMAAFVEKRPPRFTGR